LKALHDELEKAKIEEDEIDMRRNEIKELLNSIGTDEENQKLAFVTHEDIKNLAALQGSALITIKAPSGTTLEVHENEGGDDVTHKYGISLESSKGVIAVYPIVEPGQQVVYQLLLFYSRLVHESDNKVEFINVSSFKDGTESSSSGFSIYD